MATPASPLPSPAPTPPAVTLLPSSPQTEHIAGWLSGNFVAIFIVAVGVFLVWRFGRPFIHRGVMRLLDAQERAMPTGAPRDELAKRAETLEDTTNRLVRMLLVLGVLFLIFGIFDLWSVIAGLGLFLAALTLAGQSVILSAAQKTAEISLPVAISVFPDEVYRAPESWARRAYRNLIYFNEVENGGHFAAWEQPTLFSREVAAAFRPLRQH